MVCYTRIVPSWDRIWDIVSFLFSILILHFTMNFIFVGTELQDLRVQRELSVE